MRYYTDGCGQAYMANGLGQIMPAGILVNANPLVSVTPPVRRPMAPRFVKDWIEASVLLIKGYEGLDLPVNVKNRMRQIANNIMLRLGACDAANIRRCPSLITASEWNEMYRILTSVGYNISVMP